MCVPGFRPRRLPSVIPIWDLRADISRSILRRFSSRYSNASSSNLDSVMLIFYLELFFWATGIITQSGRFVLNVTHVFKLYILLCFHGLVRAAVWAFTRK